jgi:signal transduction histidine kinase
MSREIKKGKVVFGLKPKFLTYIISAIIVMGSLFSGYYINKSHKILTRELEKRGSALAHNLAFNSKYGIMTKNKDILNRLLAGVIHEEDVNTAVIYDVSGQILASRAKHGQGVPIFTPQEINGMNFKHGHYESYTQDRTPPLLNILFPVITTKTIDTSSKLSSEDKLLALGEEYEQLQPQEKADTIIGYAQISMSLQKLISERKAILRAGFLITLLIIGITAIFSFAFVRMMIKPIKAMSRTATEIARGDLSLRVNKYVQDEIGILGDCFNYMVESLEKRNIERKQAEEALKARQQEIEELNASLERRVQKEVEKSRQKDLIMMQQSRLAAMGEMIGLIAHQWRQPLNALNILLYNISDLFDDAEQKKEKLDDLIVKGLMLISKMSTTIDDFRSFFKPTKKKKKFNLNKIIKDSLSLVDASFKYNNISVVVNGEKEITMFGFPNEYSQVILNILSNAKDAIVEKEVNGEIKIDILQENEYAVVKIKDNGGGIPEDILNAIFDPYFTTKRGRRGTGLGLYLAKVIIEDHMDGVIEVQNANDGAEFMISTPISAKEA